jgi:hypothetical protein
MKATIKMKNHNILVIKCLLPNYYYRNNRKNAYIMKNVASSNQRIETTNRITKERFIRIRYVLHISICISLII